MAVTSLYKVACIFNYIWTLSESLQDLSSGLRLVEEDKTLGGREERGKEECVCTWHACVCVCDDIQALIH